MKQQEFIYFYPFMTTVPERFYPMPKFILEEGYGSLSSDAKILYTCLRDRLTLAVKENWKDQDDRLYVFYTVENAMKTLGVSKNTAHSAFVQLKDMGLIEVIRQGQGKPSKIFVKELVMPDETVSDFEKHCIKIWDNED
jgi:hypothetical protein